LKGREVKKRDSIPPIETRIVVVAAAVVVVVIVVIVVVQRALDSIRIANRNEIVLDREFVADFYRPPRYGP